MSIKKELFGKCPDGQDVYIFSLKNTLDSEIKIMNYGATLVSISVVDREGKFADVIAGYDTLEEYIRGKSYQGAIVGRYANRIAKGEFSLDEKKYTLYTNDGRNHLHGGKNGFDKKIWNAQEIDGDEPSLVLSYTSPDGEEGYPGTLKIKVTYTLKADNSLYIDYKATTDKKTPINMTNHAYFNLAGYDSRSIREQIMMLDADCFLPTDEELIPTGEIRSVEGTPFDFRVPKEIGKDIESEDICIKYANGYDHCFVFSGGETKAPVLRGSLYDKKSGRYMELFTNQPCVQIYSFNEATPKDCPFKKGTVLPLYSLVCLETQKMPDSVNHDNFNNVYLSAGETYDYTTIYKFSVK